MKNFIKHQALFGTLLSLITIGVLNNKSISIIIEKVKTYLKFKFQENHNDITKGLISTIIFYVAVIYFSFFLFKPINFYFIVLIISILFGIFLKVIFETQHQIKVKNIGLVDISKLYKKLKENGIIDGNYSTFCKFINQTEKGIFDKKIRIIKIYNKKQSNKEIVELTTSIYGNSLNFKKAHNILANYFVSFEGKPFDLKPASFNENSTKIEDSIYNIKKFIMK